MRKVRNILSTDEYAKCKLSCGWTMLTNNAIAAIAIHQKTSKLSPRVQSCAQELRDASHRVIEVSAHVTPAPWLAATLTVVHGDHLQGVAAVRGVTLQGV